MRNFLPEVKWPSEYARAGIRSVRSRLERQPVVQHLGKRMDDLLKTFDRVARAQAPRAAETVDRFIQRQFCPQPNAATPNAINATGTLFSLDASVPLPEPSIAEFCRMAQWGHGISLDDVREAQANVAAQLRPLAACEGAHVFSHPALAASAAIEAIVGGAARRIAIPKRHVVRYGGICLPQIASQVKVELVEVGTVDACGQDDFERAIREANCSAAMLVASCQVPRTEAALVAELRELSAVARAASKPVLVLAEEVMPVAMEGFYCEHLPTLRELCAMAQLLVAPGDRLLGGPTCGIAIGQKKYIAAAQELPWTASHTAPLTVVAALAATLRLWSHADQLGNLPAWQLLATTRAAVQSRTERVLDLCDGVLQGVSVRRTTSPVRLTDTPFSIAEQEFPALEIVDAKGSGHLLRQLSQSQPQILGSPNAAGDGVLLQLASVLPKQDAELAEALLLLWGAKPNSV